MKKTEPQHNPSQTQPAARQGGGASFDSPQGEHIAQLEAMMESSPQAEKHAQLGAMMDASPAMAAQRKLADMIHNSPRQAAQAKLFESIHNSPRQVAQKKTFDAIHNSPLQSAQRKKFESLFGTAQGLVQPAAQMMGSVPVNDDRGLEHEADVMGERVVQHAGEAVRSEKTDLSFPASPSLQRKVIVGNRTISKHNLFDGSAFKKRLTRAMDVQAGKLGLSRDHIRAEVINMIESDKEFPFDDTLELMEAAAEKAADAFIDESMAGYDHTQENWLVFGMDGKNKKQVEQAIKVGYRKFDCAESYGTTNMLAEVIRDSEFDRDYFTITYKFSLKNGEAQQTLKERLTQVANLFEGYVNDLLIHNMDASDAVIKSAWTVLNQLRDEEIALSVGLGNLNEGHAHLVGELQDKGEIDVIENSLSSVLTSPDLMELIRATGADFMYYDVVSTAKEIGIDSPDGIKALMSSIENQMEHDSRKGEKRTHMILSSSKLARNVDNFLEFGSGADRDIDWDDETKSNNIYGIAKWQKEQSAVEKNDRDFALDGGVKGALRGIADDNAASMRNRIVTAAGGAEQVTPQFVRSWLNTNTVLSNQVQDTVKVPARSGLKKRHLGRSLGNVMAALFGAKNCDWKWSIELVQMMVADVGDWDDFVKDAVEEIVVR